MRKFSRFVENLLTVFLFYTLLRDFVASKVCSTGLKKREGVRMKDRLLDSVNGYGYIMCIKECKSHRNCVSVSYNRRYLICDLYWSSIETESDQSQIITDPFFTYVDMADVPPSMVPSYTTQINQGSTNTKCVQLSSKKTVCVNPVSTLEQSTVPTPVSTQLSISTSVALPLESTASTTMSLTTSVVLTTPTLPACPSLYTESEDKKFCISLVQTKMSRDNAKTECRTTTDSSLLLIDSAETQSTVSTFLAQHFGSGLTENELWIDGTYQNSQWTSSMGVLSYTNWEKTRKNNEDCILLKINSGEWKPSKCDRQKFFLCQIRIS
ncbi:uncharacterized protein LOC133192901 [Saccostrea echinata]|uniref:uncharacterized protein LOC133192901 n=1 Tax=Saccostrea echinata TaxID=191078 RepID=UPI002A821E2F|nr:uncharacterized protein LOC133192901 [Saccostrea echinata]